MRHAGIGGIIPKLRARLFAEDGPEANAGATTYRVPCTGRGHGDPSPAAAAGESYRVVLDRVRDGLLRLRPDEEDTIDIRGTVDDGGTHARSTADRHVEGYRAAIDDAWALLEEIETGTPRPPELRGRYEASSA